MNATQRRPTQRILPYDLIVVVLILFAAGLLHAGLTASQPLFGSNIECVVDRDAIHAPTSMPFQTDNQTVLTRSDNYLPGVCRGNSGKRQNDIRAAGPSTIRPDERGPILRGGFSLPGDACSPYGDRRPHLVLCRLQN